MARKKTTLVSDAIKYIADRILDYELMPGNPISDNKIAQEMSEELGLKISRSPVREALMILQSEGLVEMIDDKCCVARITDRDVFEICQVRNAIEQQAVLICMEAGGFTAEQKEHLQRLHDKLLSADDDSNQQSAYSVDDDFHRYLVSCTDNSRLIDIADRMCIQMQRVRFINTFFPHRRREFNLEHGEILEAILADDRLRALDAIHAHNRNTQINFHNFFESDELRRALLCFLDTTD